MGTDPDPDHEIIDVFSQRLAEAIAHLSPERDRQIRSRMTELRIGGGLKAGIARLIGLRTQSLLSDMLAGRLKGERHRTQLAELLGVSATWLEGDDADPPAWRLLPGEAYQRWAQPLRAAWAQRCGVSLRVGVIDDHPAERAHSDSEYFAAAAAGVAIDRRAVARAVRISPADPAIVELATGAFERVEFDILLRLGEHLKLPAPSHVEHVRAGHGALREALRHRAWLANDLRRRFERYAMPPKLFQVTRLALVAQRAQRAYQGKDTGAIDDCLELLWRAQLQQSELSPHEVQAVPAEFTVETGRVAWTPLKMLRARHADSGEDPYARYCSDSPASG